MKENVYENKQHRPSWKRLYNSLGIWISFYLMVIALGFYIITVDFAFEPNQQIKPQSKNLSKSLIKTTNESSMMNKQNSIDRSETMVADDKGPQQLMKKINSK